MNKQEFERMIDEKLSAVKKELMKEYLNSLYEIATNNYPEYGTVYYCISSDGNVQSCKWTDTKVDENRFAIDNYFETREEAEFEAERLKVIAELKRFAEPKDRAWDGVKAHWSCGYDTEDKCLSYNSNFYLKHSHIYFTSDEDARKAIETVGVERFIKYYLGVEE